MLSPITKILIEVVACLALIGLIIFLIIIIIRFGYTLYMGIRDLIEDHKNKRKVDVHEEHEYY